MATEASVLPADSPPPPERQNWLDLLLGAATRYIKSSGLYFAALGVVVATLLGLWVKLGLREAYGEYGLWLFVAILAAPLVIAFVTDTLPRIRERKRETQLRQDGIAGPAVAPGYFRLRPYDARDHERFKRADGAHQEMVAWLCGAEVPLLYLTGRSGTGKSSLLAAWVLPELASAKPAFQTISARSFADPIQALGDALTKPGAIWEERPSKDTAVRTLLEMAAAKLRRRASWWCSISSRNF